MEADRIAEYLRRVMADYVRSARERRLYALLALPHLATRQSIHEARSMGYPRYRWGRN